MNGGTYEGLSGQKLHGDGRPVGESEGMSCAAISRSLNRGRNIVWEAANGKTWKHL